MPSITIRNLTKQYNGEDGQAVTALDHIDLHIKDGEFVCIVGPSGCGKSTMLKIIAGLLEKSGGEVLLDDEPVTGPSRDIGVVFQDASLYPWKTVKKNIAFGMDISKAPRVWEPNFSSRCRRPKTGSNAICVLPVRLYCIHFFKNCQLLFCQSMLLFQHTFLTPKMSAFGQR